MKIKIFLSLIVVLAFYNCQKQSEVINLKGNWTYKLDKDNLGLNEQWQNLSFTDSIILPSSLRDKGIGNTPTLKTKWTGSIYDSTWYFNPALEKYRKKDSLKFPFWLTPDKHFVGVAWYQKEITIPDNWKNKSIELLLERPHWQTKVWLDSLYIGTQNSLSVPHNFIVEKNIKPGKHLLTIRVDNAIRDLDVGINSHSISDHTQGNWNGIVGDIKLFSKNKYSINQLKLTPNIANKIVEAKIILNKKIKQNTKVSVVVNGLNHEHILEPLTYNFKKKYQRVKY